MDKILIKQKCEYCEANLTLLLSVRENDETLWLIKICEECDKRPVEELLQIPCEKEEDK